METQLLDPRLSVNEIVRRTPEALAVLQLGIDACCGGALPLAEAAGRHGVTLDEVMEALARVTRD